MGNINHNNNNKTNMINKEKLNEEEQWLFDYYQSAVGLTIQGAYLDEDGFPTLVCTKGKGKTRETVTLQVSCDEEGNRAGFLFGLINPTPIKEEAAE